jgi:hypothetical protein
MKKIYLVLFGSTVIHNYLAIQTKEVLPHDSLINFNKAEKLYFDEVNSL